ncbi:MAG: diacylglycerol/lipid kinase family protein [Candidatus Dormibacteria bacterium]
MNTVLVVNPASAGGATARDWPALEAALGAAGLDFETRFTAGRGDATRICAEALGRGATTVVAVGGDGTLNEVANGFFRDGVPVAPGARIGLLPRGTGGDFRRTLNLPDDPRAVALLLASGSTRLIDCGRVSFLGPGGEPGERVFVNIADLGIGGEVVQRVERLKWLGGRAGFQLASLLTLMGYRNRRVALEADGEAIDTVAQSVVVANCRYFGGSMEVAPMADPSDGWLDLVILGDLGRLESMRRMGSIYRGQHIGQPRVTHRRVRALTVRCSERLLLDVDGEQPGMAPASFTVMPSALRVAAP